MHPSRRRKKRPNYGIRTAEVIRGPNGFGFTISGQQPCILSCIVANSPADQAGLRAGDFLISVNGTPVSKSTHDAVVNLIGNSVGPIVMTIAENYYSDSSDEENEIPRAINSRKPRYPYKPKGQRHKLEANKFSDDYKLNSPLKKLSKSNNGGINFQSNHSYFSERSFNDSYCGWNDNYLEKPNIPNLKPENEDVIEYKALVGYLGTIEMPKQLLPSSRLQTVCNCIKKLRQEKRTPTLILMTILPTCLTLKNSNNQILAIYPLNRVVYISSTSDKDTRYFGLVTSAVCNSNSTESVNEEALLLREPMQSHMEISNSCHVFLTDPKLGDHCVHLQKADQFKITCTKDPTGNCLEFPRNAFYIVSLVQNLYKLQDSISDRANKRLNDDIFPLVANSPQPSASSNSDSGIGYRDDCGNVSDRILIVEFPVQKKIAFSNKVAFPVKKCVNRPTGIDGNNICLDTLDDPLNNDCGSSSHIKSLNSIEGIRRVNKIEAPVPEITLTKTVNTENQSGDLNMDNCYKNIILNNVRAMDNSSKISQTKENDKYINNENSFHDMSVLDQRDELNHEHHCDSSSKFSVRAMPCIKNFCLSNSSDNVKNGLVTYSERAIDVPQHDKKSFENISLHSVDEELSSVENISVNSSKGTDSNFKVPKSMCLDNKMYHKRNLKTIGSYDNLTSDKYSNSLMKYKLSPKVFGLSKPNYSCEELNKMDTVEKCSYSSLQNLCSWTNASENKRIMQSEPDVRFNGMMDDESGLRKNERPEGPSAWASSFEKLLEDPIGLQTFAAFLKKEFSAENIYFWTACERYRNNPSVSERITEAQKIYKRHLCSGAPEPVNVDSQGRQINEQSLQEANYSLFDLAQKQIFNLMKFDSYPRFLKSDLYKQCLSGKADTDFDPGLLVYPMSATPTKLKKSLSNAEDRRRKSLLPWHRKNRSKSKDRGENGYEIKREMRSNENDDCLGRNEAHSSKSSLISQESGKFLPDDASITGITGRNPLCRVILSNGSTTVVQIKQEETIQELISRVLEKRGITFSFYEVFTDKHSKPLDIRESSMILAGCEVRIEQRVVFKLYLPNKKVIAVKSKYTKILVDVLKPILNKYDYKLDQVSVNIGRDPVDVHLPVTAIEDMRLNISLKNEQNSELVQKLIEKPINTSHSLDMVTNRVFKDILNEKSDSKCPKLKSDQRSLKSEGCGSENSSSIFVKFLKKESSEVHEKRKKPNHVHSKTESLHNSCEEESEKEQNNIIKRPLIAKWKTGAKLHLPSPESDELYEGLKRAQRLRLEDQRGTEINFELPDFLKDKSSDHYEFTSNVNQSPSPNVTAQFNNNNNCYNNKTNHFRIYSPKNFSSNVSNTVVNRLDNVSSLLKCNNENPVDVSDKISNFNQHNETSINSSSPKSSEPPPLPPKPKIVPARPSNWGQNGLIIKYTPPSEDPNLYLEQGTSSFV